jgi:hypothetical protein
MEELRPTAIGYSARRGNRPKEDRTALVRSGTNSALIPTWYPEEAGATMNFRRGLFRLWIVGTALFVLAFALVNYSSIKAEFDDATPEGIARVEAIVAKIDRSRPLSQWTDDELEAVNKHPNTGPAPSPWTSVGKAAAIAFGIPLAGIIPSVGSLRVRIRVTLSHLDWEY